MVTLFKILNHHPNLYFKDFIQGKLIEVAISCLKSLFLPGYLQLTQQRRQKALLAFNTNTLFAQQIKRWREQTIIAPVVGKE